MALSDKKRDDFIDLILSLSNEIPHAIEDILNGDEIDSLSPGARKALFQQIFDKKDTFLEHLKESLPDESVLPTLNSAEEGDISTFVAACLESRRQAIYKAQASLKANNIFDVLIQGEEVFKSLGDYKQKMSDYTHGNERSTPIQKEELDEMTLKIEKTIEELNDIFSVVVLDNESLEDGERKYFLAMIEGLMNAYVESGEPPESPEIIKMREIISANKESMSKAITPESRIEVVSKVLEGITSSIAEDLQTLAKETKQYEDAITKLQAIQRKQGPEKKYNELRGNAIKIQVFAKAMLQRRKDARELKSAITIQANVKGMLAKQKYKQQMKKVVTVQAQVRGYLQRKEYSDFKNKKSVIKSLYQAREKKKASKKEGKDEMVAMIASANVKSDEIIENLTPLLDELLATTDIELIEKNKKKITEYLGDGDGGINFELQNAVVKGFVVEKLEKIFKAKQPDFRPVEGKYVSRIAHVLGDAGVFVREGIKTKIRDEVKGTIEDFDASSTKAMDKETFADAENTMTSFFRHHCTSNDKVLDLSETNRRVAVRAMRDIRADTYTETGKLTNPVADEVLACFGSDCDIIHREEFKEHIVSKLEEQYTLSNALSNSIMEELNKIPDEDNLETLSNHIPHAISDLLNGIDSPSRAKYFGSRSYTGLSQGARKNFFG
jgi:hypothetical protein